MSNFPFNYKNMKFMRSCKLISIFALSFAFISFSRADSQHPNVIVILSDDFGYGDISKLGGSQGPTRVLDHLMDQSTTFTHFYTASPVCSASRVAYITGMFPARWCITTYLNTSVRNRQWEQVDWLNPNAQTMAKVFKAAGYSTAHFGKWHMGGGFDATDAPLPSAYGYDESHVNCEGMGPRFDSYKGGDPHVPGDNKKYPRHSITEYWVDRSIDFMKRKKDGSFFISLCPQDVHMPFAPSEDAMERQPVQPGPTDAKKFRAVLNEMDLQFGKLLDAVEKEGLTQNTIIVFTGDNGPEQCYNHTRTLQLKGGKRSLYEGGIREPLIVRWPGKIPAGKIDKETIVGEVDLLPTLASLANVSLETKNLDGENMSAALTGTAIPRTKPLFWEFGRADSTAFKYRAAPENSPNLAIREGQYKALVNVNGSRAELYDMSIDEKETTNIASKHFDITKRLTQMAIDWQKTLPRPNDPAFAVCMTKSHGVTKFESDEP
jgi:arylsulfatase A-like enzyme